MSFDDLDELFPTAKPSKEQLQLEIEGLKAENSFLRKELVAVTELLEQAMTRLESANLDEEELFND